VGTLTLGLYNAYDATQFQDAMRRALARAAPVCLAFDCNLATFGMPFQSESPRLNNPRAVAQFIAESTSIGDGAAIKQLAAENRFRTYDFPGEFYPPQLGTVIVSSEHTQDHATTVTPKELAARLATEDVLVMIGLGPNGLPAKILARSTECLELTGRNIGLETATAMAALPALVYAYKGLTTKE
jgi:hypothetical protein